MLYFSEFTPANPVRATARQSRIVNLNADMCQQIKSHKKRNKNNKNNKKSKNNKNNKKRKK